MNYSNEAFKLATKYKNQILTLEDLTPLYDELANTLTVDQLTVKQRVQFSKTFLENLSVDVRKLMSQQLIKEQIVDQRKILGTWSLINAQSAMIDTGYIGQHLVSLRTQIPGQGMRGKGDDLIDGSEVKSANFLDSLDQKGATAPRWNFTANTIDIMERFLSYESTYLLSIDRSPEKMIRVRIWKVDIRNDEILSNRYKEWMTKLGYPKFEDQARPSVNFQLFPPRNETNDTFARHGNGRSNGFDKLEIPLENTTGSELIFHAEELNDGKIEIFQF